MFGINAELLIDHAWGYEPVTIADIKGYKPETNSIGSGQVLHCPYDFNQTKIIVREMTDALVLDLVEKKLVTDQLVLDVGYDIENLADPERRKKIPWRGESRPVWQSCAKRMNMGQQTLRKRHLQHHRSWRLY